MAQALLDAIARPMTIEGHEIHLTCSIGIAAARRRRPCRHAGASRQRRTAPGQAAGPQPGQRLCRRAARRRPRATGAGERAAPCAARRAARAALPAAGRPGAWPHRRRRGLAALAAPDAGPHRAGSLHPDRRRDRPDRRHRRLGAAPRHRAGGGLAARRAAAAAHGGQPVGAPVGAAGPGATHRRPARRDRPRSAAVRRRGHREHADRQLRPGGAAPASAACARRRGLARRLRHRLFEPELSAPAAGGRGQDRPLAGARRHRAGRRRVDHARHHHDGAPACR